MSRSSVLVAGDGIVGLATALACTERGLAVRVIGRRLPGAASTAAAGLLAPSLGAVTPDVMFLARDLWPAYAAMLTQVSRIPVAINTLGILEVATDERETPDRRVPPWATVLDARELGRRERALKGAAYGALHHPRDGAVDNVAALRALDESCELRRVARVDGLVRRVERGADSVAVVTGDGQRYQADVVVVAAGAWAPAIAGLPREIPVVPWRGQMLALDGAVTEHCIAGAGGYLVPRGDRTLVGSTMESVGFDAATTDDGIASLRRLAAALVPALGSAREVSRWAGVRPMTPDTLPVLGPDPDDPRIVYGCGLSKNGILLAPLVGSALAAWCGGVAPVVDLRPFAIDRFRPEEA